MRYAIGMVLVLVILSNVMTVQGEDTTTHYDGNELLRSCKALLAVLENRHRDTDGSFDSGWCLGFIHGNGATLDFAQGYYGKNDSPYCIPDGVTNGQVAHVIVKYLEDHPERLHESDIGLVFHALRAAFPCKRQDTLKR